MDSEGHTPLLKAVLYGQPSAVQSLILAGVSLDTQDSAGSTALHMAAYGGDSTILSMLLDSGADPNLQRGRH
jgi:ankyrin repeat protein